jgi:hypothetical protein
VTELEAFPALAPIEASNHHVSPAQAAVLLLGASPYIRNSTTLTLFLEQVFAFMYLLSWYNAVKKKPCRSQITSSMDTELTHAGVVLRGVLCASRL